jgi:3-phenylpropionate/trans-cinnamate dioxygenase ferredoxin reductase subunit
VERSVDILLIGGGVASVRCARTLRREGFDGSILIAGAEEVAPYNRPPLSKELLRDELPDELVAAEPESWYDRRAITLLTGTTVDRLDLASRRADLDDATSIRFDRCLIATGASPIPLTMPGAEHGMLLRTLADARQLRSRALAAGAGARVVVVGGGFIGVEVASGLASLGLRPIILEREPALWGGSLGERMAAWGRERLRATGVETRLGASATRLDPDAVWVGDERIEAAFAIVGIGVRPRVALGVAAGLAEADGIITDTEQRTNHPAAWSAGDVARTAGLRVEHWHSARESGERAGRSMLGLPVAQASAPWLFTEVGGTTVDIVGAARDWDEERWIRPDGVLAFLAGERVVQLAIIGSALDPVIARGLVDAGASSSDLEGAVRQGVDV